MVAGYEINTKKLVMFLYTNSEISERGYKKAMSSRMTPKNTWGINLTRQVTDLYAENYKILTKEI